MLLRLTSSRLRTYAPEGSNASALRRVDGKRALDLLASGSLASLSRARRQRLHALITFAAACRFDTPPFAPPAACPCAIRVRAGMMGGMSKQTKSSVQEERLRSADALRSGAMRSKVVDR